jgi:Uma2 family endonuclease
MVVMQTSEALPVAALDPAGGWTVDHLDALPDDGLRRELVDGVLLVSPAPRVPHQAVVMALYDVLRPVCPPELAVIAGPIGVRQGATRELQPDLVVIETARLREDILSVPPHLVVEVASRSTRLVDRTLKRQVYAERGVPSYWLLGVEEPGLTVLELGADGAYAEVASAGPDGTVEVSRPFPVRVTPSALVP